MYKTDKSAGNVVSVGHMLAQVLTFEYAAFACGYFLFMTFLWWLRRPLRNAGLVDFGWPCGLVGIAVYFLLMGTGWTPRRAILCGMYAFCGARFILGWIVRNVRDGEDRRWNYWRQHWREGKGTMGIRSVETNFLIFYHAQTLTTLFVFAAPLAMTAQASDKGLHFLEWTGVAWGFGCSPSRWRTYQCCLFGSWLLQTQLLVPSIPR